MKNRAVEIRREITEANVTSTGTPYGRGRAEIMKQSHS